MLLFTRREGESLILETNNGPIEINLAYLNGEHARIGIDAPSSVAVVRKEVGRPGAREEVPVKHDMDEESWWDHPEDITA